MQADSIKYNKECETFTNEFKIFMVDFMLFCKLFSMQHAGREDRVQACGKACSGADTELLLLREEVALLACIASAVLPPSHSNSETERASAFSSLVLLRGRGGPSRGTDLLREGAPSCMRGPCRALEVPETNG